MFPVSGVLIIVPDVPFLVYISCFLCMFAIFSDVLFIVSGVSLHVNLHSCLSFWTLSGSHVEWFETDHAGRRCVFRAEEKPHRGDDVCSSDLSLI